MSKQRKYDEVETFERIQHYCAYQERGHQEVRDRLYLWGCHKNEVESLIVRLIEENYLNEVRFAQAYVSGKFRIKRWGKSKITRELKLKRISSQCIAMGLKEIADEDYINTIDQLIERRLKETHEKNEFHKRGKVVRYLVSRGFEPELVWQRLVFLEGPKA